MRSSLRSQTITSSRRRPDVDYVKVLGLITHATYEQEPIEEDENGGRKMTASTRVTPQGGVISPLLANVYLHEFDRDFHGKDGPAEFASARLVRYADNFVVLARY